MDTNQVLANINLINHGGEIYTSFSLNGVVNLHQKKVLPIDIDVTDLNLLKKIITIIYSNSFDKINLYKSRRGYTILCYSHNLSNEDQYNFLFSLEEEGADISFLKQFILLKKYEEPFTKNFFATRTGPKIHKLEQAFDDNQDLSKMFDDNIKKDISIITNFLKYFNNDTNNASQVMNYVEIAQKNICFFKDFFYYYNRLDLLNAFKPIYEKILENPNVATKKYLGTIQKDDNIIPDNVENIFKIYDEQTMALREDIKYLI